VDDNGNAATTMLGLDGFVLLAVSHHDGEFEQAIETTAAEAFCRGCGVQAALHNRRPTWVRDLPSAGRPVTLVWVKRVWRCREPRCPVVTWSETSEAIRPRASLTERARAEACRRVGQDGHSVAQVAAEFGVAWRTVMDAVVVYGTHWSTTRIGWPACARWAWMRRRSWPPPPVTTPSTSLGWST